MAESATIARPYARAAFESARAENGVGVWSEFLSRARMAAQDERVMGLLGNPRVRAAELVTFLLEVTGTGDHAGVRNYLQLLADNRRLDLLPEIATQFATLRSELESTLDVTITSALPLTDEQREKLSAALAKRLRRTIRIDAQIDPSLIGGAIVRAGDFVMDGSLKGRVERLGNAMSTG